MEEQGTLARSAPSEVTPLLSQTHDESQQPSRNEIGERQDGTTDANEPPTEASRPPPRVITLLTALSLFLVVGVLLFYVIAMILAQGLPRRGQLPWWAEDNGTALVALSALSILFSAINLAFLRRRSVAMPTFFNMVIDAFLAFYISGVALRALNFASVDDHYQLCKVYGIDGIDPNCISRAKAINILLIVSFTFGVLVSVVYLILFILRGVGLIRSFRDQQNRNWTIPAGQLTFEFSIKFLRQEEGAVPGPSAS